MRIVKGETPQFEQYQVEVLETFQLENSFWKRVWGKQYTEETRVKILTGVLEADDGNGMIVQQVYNHNGEEIYTNGKDDIVIDNPVKLLLLLPNIRQAFLFAKFRPKVTSSYRQGVRIIFRGVFKEVILKEPQPPTTEMLAETV